MSWLLRDNWLGSLLAFLLGAAITWRLLNRPSPAPTSAPAERMAPPAPAERVAPTSAPAERVASPAPAPVERPAPPAPVVVDKPAFSQLMDDEATLFDHIEEEKPAVPAGRYGEGSADAVPHQGPPDGFTIKGNAQSMLFHTPDSPYYGRTKPEVWFRTEADAERAGFTKYTRRPRKSPDPRS
ncbi:hypothetical protein GCM10009630_44910 [Kribbella jejuensis]|uniref:Membrane protein ArfC n=1 Tax=Kribbella jejuensis TaxID=236068 RepID=A0A542EMV4_9ACTN|nr:hypothetical protein [Kribbella jejuensis]TQJ16680.1 hypothetical protein FB475_0785 [Kribbella jejuensis]